MSSKVIFVFLGALGVLASAGCQTSRPVKFQTEVGVGYKTPEGLEVTVSLVTDRAPTPAPGKAADPDLVKLKFDVKYAEKNITTPPAKK